MLRRINGSRGNEKAFDTPWIFPETQADAFPQGKDDQRSLNNKVSVPWMLLTVTCLIESLVLGSLEPLSEVSSHQIWSLLETPLLTSCPLWVRGFGGSSEVTPFPTTVV